MGMLDVVIFTVYKNPKDYPGKFVVRRFLGDRPDDKPICVEDSYEEAIKQIPSGLFRMDKMPGDDSVIVETWI